MRAEACATWVRPARRVRLPVRVFPERWVPALLFFRPHSRRGGVQSPLTRALRTGIFARTYPRARAAMVAGLARPAMSAFTVDPTHLGGLLIGFAPSENQDDPRALRNALGASSPKALQCLRGRDKDRKGHAQFLHSFPSLTKAYPFSLMQEDRCMRPPPTTGHIPRDHALQ